MAIVLLGVVPLFGWLASRVPRLRLITITTLFFASNLVLFYVAGPRRGQAGGAVLHLAGRLQRVRRGAVLVVRQRHLHGRPGPAALSDGRRRRVAGRVGRARRAWARWCGAFAFTPFTLMLLAGVVLIVALGVTWIVNQRETARADPEGKRRTRRRSARRAASRWSCRTRISLDWRADHPAQHRQHGRRVPAEPDRRKRCPGDRRPGRNASGS